MSQLERIVNRLNYYLKKYNYDKRLTFNVRKPASQFLLTVFYMLSQGYFTGKQNDLRRFFTLIYHYFNIGYKQKFKK